MMQLTMMGLLISTAYVVGVVPTTAAHDCQAQNPATSCGECTSGDHHHTYNNGTNYCNSSGGSGGGSGSCNIPGTAIGPGVAVLSTTNVLSRNPRFIAVNCEILPELAAVKEIGTYQVGATGPGVLRLSS